MYVPKSLAIEDGIFGESTKVITLNDSVYDDYQKLIAPLGFNCLPLRYHMGPRGIELLRGEEALKNFDTTTRGKLHPEVARVWRSYQRKARLRAIK